MENSIISSSFSTNILFTLLIASLSLFFFFFISSLIRTRRSITQSGDKRITPPEPSGSWPLLGHLPLLSGSLPSHLVLAKLADSCGPIFTVRLGVHRAVVVNTWEIAKECLTTHDQTFAARSKSTNSEILGYNYAMFGLSEYGSYWRHVRKISTVELLSTHRLDILKHIRESEVRVSIKDAYTRWRERTSFPEKSAVVLLDVTRWFNNLMLNITFRMIIGKRFREGDQVDEKERRALKDWFGLLGQFTVSDVVPFLGWLDLGGYKKAMRRTAKELDEMMQRLLDEQKAAKLRSGGGDDEEEEGEEEKKKKRNQGNFMDVLLSTIQNYEEVVQSYDADTVIKATCLAMVLGATNTTTITLVWAIRLLLNHKEALKKVQQELDAKIGKGMPVKESDIKNLPYLQAVIKETMRLYPAAPAGIPHEAIHDCTVQGYFVLTGTRLILNLHKIQRDPRVWTDPDEFKPERFVTTHQDYDVRGQNFELMPFGSGRRMCPGMSLGLSVVQLSLASFLQSFDVQSLGDEPVDMTDSIGLTHLEALIKPRLSHFMYE